MASYADLDSLKAWLSAGDDSAVTWTGDEEATAQLLLDSATTFIERYTGRLFRAEAGATKYFYPTDTHQLALPDIRTLTSLAYDERGDGTFSQTLTLGTHIYLTPLQPFPDAGIYTGVRVYPNSPRGFYGAYQVKVVGDWGYVVNGAAPGPIQQACIMEAARLWARKGAPLGVVVNANIGTFTRLTAGDGDVKAILDQYRAATIAGEWLVV